MLNSFEHPPHPLVLETQLRICTGPRQSRPLVHTHGPDPDQVFDLVFSSAKEVPALAEPASAAQIGAVLIALSLRRRFPPATTWSTEERQAIDRASNVYGKLPQPYRFLLDVSERPSVADQPDASLIEALEPVLRGEHLTYADARRGATAALDPTAHPALCAAFLIGQRMNLETYEEFCGHLDAVHDRSEAIRIELPSLTHVGEPYTGNARFFRPTVFVAAVRAAQGHATFLHGIDRLPPKWGVTDEQMLTALGANVDLPLEIAADLLSDPDVGFTYVSQRAYAPAATRVRDLRHHIAKRPPWAATEKAHRPVRATGTNHAVIGYHHSGYEDKHLRLMREDGIDIGVMIKGEEGSAQFSLRSRQPDSDSRKSVNHFEGFVDKKTSSGTLDPARFGLAHKTSPRAETVSAEAFARAGLRALEGERGADCDRILLNAAGLNVLLGLETNPAVAVAAAQDAIESGRALSHLERYVARSREAVEFA